MRVEFAQSITRAATFAAKTYVGALLAAADPRPTGFYLLNKTTAAACAGQNWYMACRRNSRSR
jgi:hypothetical protein